MNLSLNIYMSRLNRQNNCRVRVWLAQTALLGLGFFAIQCEFSNRFILSGDTRLLLRGCRRRRKGKPTHLFPSQLVESLLIFRFTTSSALHICMDVGYGPKHSNTAIDAKCTQKPNIKLCCLPKAPAHTGTHWSSLFPATLSVSFLQSQAGFCLHPPLSPLFLWEQETVLFHLVWADKPSAAT